MSDSNEFYDLYRKDSDGGNGTKDWAIKVTNVGKITVKYGKTGAKLRTQEIPSDRPGEEASKRTQKKIAEGYEIIGRFTISDSGAISSANEERRYFNLRKVDKSSYEAALNEIVSEISSFDFCDNVLTVEEGELGDPLFKCPGFLSDSGWTFGFTPFQDFVSGDGVIEKELQILLLASLASKLNDMSKDSIVRHLTVESASGPGTEKSIIPEGRGLPDEFTQSLSLPKDFILDVAMATGLIPKPIPLFNQDSVSTGTGICF